MAKSIRFDTGVEEYEVNDGKAILRFNPADPELFARILDFQDVLLGFQEKYTGLTRGMTGELDEEGFPIGAKETLDGIRELDADIKKSLQDIFGTDNDFDAILDHRSAMALTNSGDTVINNFLLAVAPLIKGDGEERVAISKKVDAARKKAQGNRQQRRASQKKK